MSTIDNLPQGGTDDALQSLSIDDALNIDFDDPSEGTDEIEQDEQSEEVTDEADSQEADTETAEDDDQTETEDEGTAGKADKPEPTDDVTVTVNGTPLSLSELKAGYQRQQDYSRKTMEVAETRKGLEALTSRVTNTVNTIADYLVRQIPAAPDPSLAMTDPAKFVQQKAVHEAAVQQVSALLSQAGEAKQVAGELTAQQRAEVLRAENAKLAELFPQTTSDEGRKQFFNTAAKAAKELGYSDDEIGTVTDHRMFAVAHYAALGLAAEQAKAKAAKKVENKPPVAPQKRQQGANASQAARNKEAMNRLARSGSIHDAVKIDWE